MRQLPADAIVYLPGLRQDGTGKRLVPREVATQIVSISPVPVYGNNSNFLQVGTMGGYIAPIEEIARPAGKLLARLLRGEKPEALAVPSAIPNAYILNMHQLRRFGFDESAIPPGADVRFRPPSLWEQHKLLIVSGTAIVLFQAALISALLLQRARRRRAEKEALDLSGRLLTAHEDERRRLARELHDDLTQRLARLAIDAGRMESTSGAPEGARPLREDLVRLSEDVHALSYRLHPSVLDDLGLVEALRAECDRVARHGELRVDVEASGVPKGLPAEASLCLFRVAQEALSNAVRHARASAVTVLLSASGKGLQLAVSDNGGGFDPGHARERASLGLASMRERVRLVRGELDIESTPGRGTTWSLGARVSPRATPGANPERFAREWPRFAQEWPASREGGRMTKPRVLLADDHRIVAEGLKGLLEEEFELVGIVEDGRAMVKAARELRPDVIVADISMPHLNGIDALAQLKHDNPKVRVVFLTMHRDVAYARRALEAGAAGFVLKHSAPAELVLALRAALQGRTFVAPDLAAELLRTAKQEGKGAADPVAALTPRQREILQLHAEGKSAKEIAAVLGLSARTVEDHKYRLMESLGIENSAELVHFAIKHGLVP